MSNLTKEILRAIHRGIDLEWSENGEQWYDFTTETCGDDLIIRIVESDDLVRIKPIKISYRLYLTSGDLSIERHMVLVWRSNNYNRETQEEISSKYNFVKWLDDEKEIYV